MFAWTRIHPIYYLNVPPTQPLPLPYNRTPLLSVHLLIGHLQGLVPIPAEGVFIVVHDGAKVIHEALTVNFLQGAFVEIGFQIRSYILNIDLHEFVSVWAVLFMPETNHVT